MIKDIVITILIGTAIIVGIAVIVGWLTGHWGSRSRTHRPSVVLEIQRNLGS